MKRFILALLLLAQPVWANEQGTSPLIVFRNGASRTNEVLMTKDSNIAAPDKAYEFVGEDRNAGNYTHDGSILIYSPIVVVADPPPKPAKFVIDCNADGTLTASLRQNINLMALWFKNSEKSIALDIWTLIKAGATAGQVTAIRGHAADNNITLP